MKKIKLSSRSADFFSDGEAREADRLRAEQREQKLLHAAPAVSLLTAKIARQQSRLCDMLPSLIAEAQRALDLAHESDRLSEELGDLTGGSLAAYNADLQAVAETDLANTLRALQTALSTARKFRVAASKLDAEKFLVHCGHTPAHRNDASNGAPKDAC